MSVLSLSRLSYSYPDQSGRALDGAGLELDGGLTLLTGASGSGKSTLLRVCNGLIPHFHGGVIGGVARVMGREVALTPTRDLARDVGFVFQDPELQAVYATVERDAAFGLENLGVPRPEMLRRVEEALETCGIAHLRGRAVATLSGGERQRLALAGVLAMRPRLLVLDEPLSQLDPEGAAALLAALGRAVRGGTAVLLAEHRQALARPLAQRVLRMHGGRPHDATAPEPSPGTPAVAAPAAPALLPHLPRAPAETWRLRGVTAGHGRNPVLHDLWLSAGSGEVVAVVGPNGSGKSTLLRTIAGLLPPLAGRVERAPGRVAYLPQNPSMLLHRPTVRSEVEWTLRRSGSRESADRVLLGLGAGGVAERDPRDLSSGERQRAALAAVLAGGPRLALLDEPTRGMDAAARSALVAAVEGIAASGGCVVIATHDEELAMALAGRLVLLDRGTAGERGSPRAGHA